MVSSPLNFGLCMSPLRFFCVWAAARLLGFSPRVLVLSTAACVGGSCTKSHPHRSAWGNLLTGWMAAKAQRQELRRRLTASQCHAGSLAAIASPGDWRTRMKRDVTFHEWRTWVRQDQAEHPRRPNDAEGLVRALPPSTGPPRRPHRRSTRRLTSRCRRQSVSQRAVPVHGPSPTLWPLALLALTR